MKKMLILVMVLGLVSVANAGIINLVSTLVDNDASGDLTVGDRLDLVINSTVALDAYDFALSISGTGAGTLVETNGGPGLVVGVAPVNRADNFYGFNGMWVYSGISGNAITGMSDVYNDMVNHFAIGDMVWGLAIDVTGEGTLNIDLDLGPAVIQIGTTKYYDEDLGDLSLTVVPEPITVALLGLGALFIRRRK